MRFSDRLTRQIKRRRLTVLRVLVLSRMSWFGLMNRLKRSPVTHDAGPVVSLTTYGLRLKTVHLTIETIARGSVLPSRLILWLDEKEVFDDLPAPLRRLKQRGLEVKLCENYGPFKKFYPYVRGEKTFERALVTADDDVFYPRDWLERLVNAHKQAPHVIHCHRAKRIALKESWFAKYADWKLCDTTEPSFRHMSTGVAGAIYPPEFQRVLKDSGTAFLECCPHADDLWLHVQALRHGYRVGQVNARPAAYGEMPGTQVNALYRSNVGPEDGNDQQIRATYTEADVAILRGE